MNRTDPTTRSIVYARVSTTVQATDGHCLDAQLERGQGYAVAIGCIPSEDAVDAGVSEPGPAADAQRLVALGHRPPFLAPGVHVGGPTNRLIPSLPRGRQCA